MDQEQKNIDPEEVARLRTAEQLDEVDYLKIRLMNRNVDFFTQQAQLAQLQVLEANRALMKLSEEMFNKYGLEDARQIDVASGKINRELLLQSTPPVGTEGPK